MEYFRMVEEKKAALPLVAHELNYTFPACYTTQAETKKNNRQMESLLTTAEKFSALAVTSGYRDYYPERDLDEAWKVVLRNQFHDILDGSSIGPVYEEVRRFYQEARGRGQRALDFSREVLSGRSPRRSRTPSTRAARASHLSSTIRWLGSARISFRFLSPARLRLRRKSWMRRERP